MRKNCLPDIAKLAMLCLLFAVLAEKCFADSANGFFFVREASTGKQDSCEETLLMLRDKQSIDELAGDIIYNLRYINIHYLLEDYDEATRPGSKKKYISKADLEKEIKAKKRAIYCRVELAVFLSSQPQEVTFGLESSIATALERIEETYQAALYSLRKKDYPRARFAFDLIAPYKDAHDKYLVAAAHLEQMEKDLKIARGAVEKSKVSAVAERKAAVQNGPMAAAGPISKAVMQSSRRENAAIGPISRAARRM